jgi:pyrroline-5-carboxylate reductase
MTCICVVNDTDASNEFTSNLFNQLGKTVLVEEKFMDVATVLALVAPLIQWVLCLLIFKLISRLVFWRK